MRYRLVPGCGYATDAPQLEAYASWQAVTSRTVLPIWSAAASTKSALPDHMNQPTQPTNKPGSSNSSALQARVPPQQQAIRTRKLFLAILLASSLSISAQSTQPDNSKANKGDQKAGAITADQQKMSASDRDLTQKIRKAVIADKSLSTYAHNVKIISRDGVVTLKGPVKSDDEKKSIVSKAVAATGSADKVSDQLTISN
jgi:hyperosmotically inducible protein